MSCRRTACSRPTLRCTTSTVRSPSATASASSWPNVLPERQVAFVWIGGPGHSMLGLWAGSAAPNVMRLQGRGGCCTSLPWGSPRTPPRRPTAPRPEARQQSARPSRRPRWCDRGCRAGSGVGHDPTPRTGAALGLTGVARSASADRDGLPEGRPSRRGGLSRSCRSEMVSLMRRKAWHGAAQEPPGLVSAGFSRPCAGTARSRQSPLL